MSSAYIGELSGDSVGINVDLHLLFDELVGLLNLGTLETLSRSCVLCVQGRILKYS